MLFSELLEASGAPVKSRRGEAAVEGVALDSRQCRKGSCMIAAKGETTDGHAFIRQAVAAGASAIICQDDSLTDPDVACAVLDDTRAWAGPIAQAFHGWPSRRLTTIGITGTKGKSTTAYILRSILTHVGRKAAVLGTIEYNTGGRSIPAPNTTPDGVQLASLCAESLNAGCTHLVMEVSSHALDQHRVAGMEFNVGVFTNLSGDHMDYHKNADAYFAAKRKLFEGLSPSSVGVINVDDDRAASLVRAVCGRVITYGIRGKCDLRAQIERIDSSGMRMALCMQGERRVIRTSLLGTHNAYNCLAAAGAAVALGLGFEAVAEALEQDIKVPGRLESVETHAGFRVLVDYAHTDDSLRNVLSLTRELCAKGRIIVVFGCGGDRDRTKRPRMARVAEELADVLVVTSDNPRTESPQSIIDEVVGGFTPQGRRKAIVEIDRRSAIALAVNEAREGDIVLIAGKGHETYQIIGAAREHFDDREVAAQAVAAREGV